VVGDASVLHQKPNSRCVVVFGRDAQRSGKGLAQQRINARAVVEDRALSRLFHSGFQFPLHVALGCCKYGIKQCTPMSTVAFYVHSGFV
jgi:hypothetical protein